VCRGLFDAILAKPGDQAVEHFLATVVPVADAYSWAGRLILTTAPVVRAR